MSPATLEREVAKIVMDILQFEMDLDAAHCLLGDQKWDIPTDKKLFMVIFDQSPKPFGAANFLNADQASANFGKEIQQGAFMHDVRIEMMSFGNEARTRKEELGLALNSFYAQQLAEQYGIQIGRAQSPLEASETEVAGRLLKYVLHVNITAMHQKVKAMPEPADYYNKFNGATVDGTAKPPEVNINE